MTVATIAREHLAETEEGYYATQWADSILEPLVKFTSEKVCPFVEGAVWPDRIRAGGWSSMFQWHFKDNNIVEPKFKGKLPDVYPHGVVWSINDSIKILKSSKKDTRGQSQSILGKSIAMRNLIHFIGDAHQPLHCSNRVTGEFPNGDLGGNLFRIEHYPGESIYMNNLHFIWDHMLDMNEQNMRGPITMDQYKSLIKVGREFIDKMAGDEDYKNDLKNHKKADDWCTESYETAINFVYKGLTPGDEIPQWYIDQGRVIVQRRIALGGRRLADTLLEIYRTQIGGSEKQGKGEVQLDKDVNQDQ